MQSEPIFKLTSKYTEYIKYIEQNEIDQLKDKLNQSLLEKREAEEFELIKFALKMNNQPAVNVILSFYETISVFEIPFQCSVQQVTVQSLIGYAIDYSTIEIFIFLLKRLRIEVNNIDNLLIKKIFERGRYSFIEYLLMNSGFKYKISKKYLVDCSFLCSSIVYSGLSLDVQYIKDKEKEKEKDKENDKENQLNVEKDLNSYCYFNCGSSLEYDNDESIFNLDEWIVKDKSRRLLIIRAFKYFLVKYKSGAGHNFSIRQQKKILKYI